MIIQLWTKNENKVNVHEVIMTHMTKKKVKINQEKIGEREKKMRDTKKNSDHIRLINLNIVLSKVKINRY